ncbi:jhy protein homolog isoform X1 [Tachysurus vachellii]|uniref:jhy protein homolog isoform X1 n=1 Tax=Tachysurus vachellii TaxID=175792 RepID=UPI00296AECDF|nr:jhy protein homolog isoform X1 [Tachysurus vachellii]
MNNRDTERRYLYRDRSPSDEDVSHDLLDSLDSDTESLVQDKTHHRELQMRILNGVGESSSSYDDNIERSKHEDDFAFDPKPAITETFGDQNINYSRQMSPLDEYADLRYDPDWRKKLPRSEFLQTDFLFNTNEDPAVTLRHTEHVSPRERHEYVIVHSPVSSEIDTVHNRLPQSSFHLHPVPQNTSVSLGTIPCSNSDKPMNVKHRINNQQGETGILPFSSPHERQNDGKEQSIAQEQNRNNLNAVAVQRKRIQKVRPTKMKEDIVERNKASLGMNHKQGSYLKAYEQRGRKSDDSKQPLQSAEDDASTDSPGSPVNALNLELMWIQKTQKLKTHNQSKHLDRARPPHHRTKPRGHLNQLVEKQHSQTPSEKQCLSPSDSGSGSHSSFLSAPTVSLNININTLTPATLAEPFIDHEPPKQLYTLSPSPHWKIRNDELNSHFKGSSYTSCLPVPTGGTVDHESIQVTNKNNIRSPPTHPPFQHGEESSNPAHALQIYTGVYPVLPPIGVSNTSDTELCSGRPEEATNTIHRSSSEGYLAQLMKQKQINGKTTYKAYTLKDYKSLNWDVKLRGLGPSNIIAEDVAKKISQQKLYSNVVRENNKKISKIPTLPTRNPVERDNKSNIPRNKALEYAKTISKPKASQQLKERPKDKYKSEREFEHSADLQLRVDYTQLSIVEMLRKRHEQEKLLVARFTNINGGSSHSVGSH